MFQAESEAIMDAPTTTEGTNTRPPLGLVQEGIETALNLAGVGVWQHFVPEGWVLCSDGFYELVGVDPAAGRNEPDFWRNRVHPDDMVQQQSAYLDFIQGVAKAYEEIYRVRHEKGHWLSVMGRARWASRSHGAAGGCALGYVFDVTASSQDFDRLRAREERFRMSLSALHGVVYDHDLRTNRSERNGLKRVLGYDELNSADEYGGWLAIVHPDDLAHVAATIAASRRTGSNYELSYRVRHKDGRWRQVSQRSTYTLGPDSKPIRAFGVVEDVTEAHEQSEKLKLQAAIIERMSEGVILVSRDATILFANPALEKLFGYERGTLTGKNAQILSFRSSVSFGGLMHSLFSGAENDTTSIIDLEGRRRDNSMCPVQLYFSPMQLGQERCVVAVMTDVSERKQLERELMQVATRVQQRIGGDLHDGLGQQLAGVAMMLQGLGQRAVHAGSPALHAEVEEIVSLVNAAIRSTRSLARGLSPVRASREGLVEGFEELVNQVEERYHIRVQMELKLPTDLQVDENDATNLYRIAQEGVLNAARHADAGNIFLRFRVSGADIELLVIDDGKGFDPMEFARGSMGLRIMRFRAQLIGGYLSVESRPGGGTTLRCRCPLKVSKEAA
jgi:PAS domain S-box-containing protein